MKNSCGKTTVIKKHDKLQRLNQKNYVLLIITFLQIHLALTFSICFVTMTLFVLYFIRLWRLVFLPEKFVLYAFRMWSYNHWIRLGYSISTNY